jgi:hypothetical protein
VNATPYDPGQALGSIQPQPDYDDFGKPGATRPGGISVGLRHNWLATLWWRDLGVIDGRLVLDVWRQPDGPHAGRLVARVIDWAGYVGYAETTTTRPGWIGTTDVLLLPPSAPGDLHPPHHRRSRSPTPLSQRYWASRPRSAQAA